jgi:hypothetical protein
MTALITIKEILALDQSSHPPSIHANPVRHKITYKTYSKINHLKTPVFTNMLHPLELRDNAYMTHIIAIENARPTQRACPMFAFSEFFMRLYA